MSRPDPPLTTKSRGRMESLAALHRPRVRRIAMGFLRDSDAAEDVTQETFLRLHRSPPELPDERVGSWLYSVATNLCRDHLRRRSRHPAPLESDDPASTVALSEHPDPADRLDRARARAALDEAIANLPDDQAKAIRLRFMEGLSYSEIARRTEVPEGTVASRVFRALARLGRTVEALHTEVL